MVKILSLLIPNWSVKNDIGDEQCWWVIPSKHDWVSLNWHWWIFIFLPNAITIESLENTWRLFICLHWTLIKNLPFGINFFLMTKQLTLSLRKYGNLQAKQKTIPFLIFTSMFHHVSRNIGFLNQLWNCYNSFTFKPNQLHMIIMYFLGINWSSVSGVSVVEKITSLESIGKILFIAPMAICHHLKIFCQSLLSMIHFQFSKTC